MLLTGDARGDDVLAGLREAGLLRRSPLHVDVLKLPHHGSDRNVETTSSARSSPTTTSSRPTGRTTTPRWRRCR